MNNKETTAEAIDVGTQDRECSPFHPIVRQSFLDHLELASTIVATWPAWKRNVLRLWDDGQ